MIRDTSRETYRNIIESGLLSERKEQVYKIVYEYGPMTGEQVSRKARELFGLNGTSESIRNRLTELRDMGVLQEKGTTMAGSGHVIVWDITGELPVKLKKLKPVYKWICSFCHQALDTDEGHPCMGKIEKFKKCEG